MKKSALISTLFAALLLTSCVLIHGYTPPVEQGNEISSQQIAHIKAGMSINAVENMMGTPMMINTFRNNQLEYIYTYQKGGRLLQRQQLIIDFVNGRVSHIYF